MSVCDRCGEAWQNTHLCPVTDADVIAKLTRENDKLKEAIAEHHRQKADDRCIEDDDKLYAAAVLPPCDRDVGSPEAMLRNCARFIANRCKGGTWPTYAELEARVAELENESKQLNRVICGGTRLPDGQLTQDAEFVAMKFGGDEAEIVRLRKLIEFDRTGLANALVRCRNVVGNYGWIPAGSWGSYEWDERHMTNLRAEIARAFDEIDKIAKDALQESGACAVKAFHDGPRYSFRELSRAKVWLEIREAAGRVLARAKSEPISEQWILDAVGCARVILGKLE